MTIRHASAETIPSLSRLDLFADADRELLADVDRRSTAIEVEPGHVLISEGDDARELVVIVDGYAAVSIAGVTISHVGAGSCVGEMSLLDGRRRTATVTSASPMRVITITRDDFAVLLGQEPSFCTRILTTLAGRLRLADAQLAERAAAEPGIPRARVARSVSTGVRAGDRFMAGGSEVTPMDSKNDPVRRWMARSLAWEWTLARLRRNAGVTADGPTGRPAAATAEPDEASTCVPSRVDTPRRGVAGIGQTEVTVPPHGRRRLRRRRAGIRASR
jgi:CRP-like cAMP-binding protein